MVTIMWFSRVTLTLLVVTSVVDGKKHWTQRDWVEHLSKRQQLQHETQPKVAKREAVESKFLNLDSKKFYVDGTSLPEVTFDAGESYAGTLPNDENGDLFFWFWPTTAKDEPKEILLWLNGGPGCSSMDGFFKENGAVLWPSGSPYPVLNPWSFHHITNVVWVDQPVGTGYSQGNVTAQDEGDIARQFLGFWKNFIDTFEMEGYKVYITGESYAGMYCPYIAHEMIKANDSKYFDVDGMMIYDPSIGSGMLTEMSTKYFHDSWKHAIPLNDTAAAALEEMADKCNYTTYLDEYLTYPPSKAQPDVDTLPAASDEECDAQNFLINAALEINPGFNLYQVTQLPPVPWDVEGFPYSDFYTYPNTSIYFDRPDVKKALHVSENVKWEICSTGSVFVGGDSSLPSALHEIPAVIESTNNVQIHHGVLDFVLTVNATLLTIQNMTWNGAMGLSEMPREPLFVPYHENSFVPTSAGAGVLGSWVEQRGLTVGIVTLTGHMIPEWVPGIAFRQIEVLLRRVENLASTKPFPQSPKSPQPKASGLGRGTAGTNWGRVLKT